MRGNESPLELAAKREFELLSFCMKIGLELNSSIGVRGFRP